jgi:hypothetical protein
MSKKKHLVRGVLAGLAGGQVAYWHTVYTGQTPQLPAPNSWRTELPGAGQRGTLGAILAVALQGHLRRHLGLLRQHLR